MSNKTAGQIFKEARLKNGLTQAELAQKSKVHANTIAKIERDEQNPSFATAKKLTKVLDIDLGDIPA